MRDQVYNPEGATLRQHPLTIDEAVPSGLPTLTDQEVLQQHNIFIEFLSVGAMIRIGCKTIPFRSAKEAIEELYAYVNNPKREIERWKKIFNKQ